MPRDYFQVTPNSPPKATIPPNTVSIGLAFFSRYVLEQALLMQERILKLIHASSAPPPPPKPKYIGRATGQAARLKISPSDAVELKANEIIRRLQADLHQVPDLASGFVMTSTDEANRGRGPNEFHLVEIDRRSYDFANLLIYAASRGYVVTSTIDEPGVHGDLSFHYDGRAIDIRTKRLSKQEVDQIRHDFASLGVRCYDETVKENLTDKSTAYHLHFDTANTEEVIQRTLVRKNHGTRIDLGVGDGWPARR